MNISNVLLSLSLNGRVTPTESGVLQSYRVGVADLAPALPACDLAVVRDVALNLGQTRVLNLDDFSLTTESDPYRNPDGGVVAFNSIYALLLQISGLPTVPVRVRAVISDVGFPTSGTPSLTQYLWANTTNADCLVLLTFPLGLVIGGSSLITFAEQLNGSGGSPACTVRVTAFGVEED